MQAVQYGKLIQAAGRQKPADDGGLERKVCIFRGFPNEDTAEPAQRPNSLQPVQEAFYCLRGKKGGDILKEKDSILEILPCRRQRGIRQLPQPGMTAKQPSPDDSLALYTDIAWIRIIRPDMGGIRISRRFPGPLPGGFHRADLVRVKQHLAKPFFAVAMPAARFRDGGQQVVPKKLDSPQE